MRIRDSFWTKKKWRKHTVIESSFTLYKLIILYMLQNVNFPLSNTQISDFILEKEYTNYFHLQEALSELQEYKADRDREGAQHLVLPHD